MGKLIHVQTHTGKRILEEEDKDIHICELPFMH